MRTNIGMTKSAIWIQLPTATLIARSNFPFRATTTAVVCSAALLMIGMTIRVMNSLDTLGLAATRPSSEPTRCSAVKYARAVDATSRKTAEGALSLRCSSVEEADETEDADVIGLGRVSVEPRSYSDLFDDTEVSQDWQVSRKR